MANLINAKTSGAGGLETTADNTGNINIQSGGSTVMEVTSAGVAVTGSLTQNGGAYSTQPTFRNRIINGNMTIDQRNAGASVTLVAASTYCVDRWNGEESTDGTATLQQVVDAPNGFINSLKFTTTSADASLGATQYVITRQFIEGFNTADLMWGTANAKTVTLSFWAKSTLTGTMGGSILNANYNRSYPFTYTISSANTWEYKTITIAGDTSGTWEVGNGAGPRVTFSQGAGSTYSGTAGSWSGSLFLGATGQVQVIGTLNATWQITGVQLEVDTTATDFEQLQYTTQLQLCQRYYYATSSAFIAATATTLCYNLQFPVTMRATPTETHSYAGVANDVYNIATAATPTFVPNGNFPINTGMKFAYDFDAGLTAGQAYQTEWTFSAEL